MLGCLKTRVLLSIPFRSLSAWWTLTGANAESSAGSLLKSVVHIVGVVSCAYALIGAPSGLKIYLYCRDQACSALAEQT